MATTAMGLLLMRKSSRKKSGSPLKEKKEEEEDEIEKSIYLCANMCVDGLPVTEWYAIKLSSKDYCSLKKRKKNSGRGKEIYIKPFLADKPIRRSSYSVALGSTIYCGGSVDGEYVSRDVYAWDTTNNATTSCWEAVAAMNIKREAGYSIRRESGFTKAVVAADGKIYVFGGIDKAAEPIADKYLCEVFDPSKNKWEPINPPIPPEALPFLQVKSIHDHVFAVYDDTSSRILLGSLMNGFLLAYNVRAASWNTPRPMPMPSIPDIYVVGRSNPVLFDNTLYWIKSVENRYYKCGVYAYDFDNEKLFYGPIVGVHPYFWDCRGSAMQFLHFRGDEFYLIWHDNPDPDFVHDCPDFVHDYPDFVRCERMRISKREDSMTCYVLSTKSYVIGGGQPYGISALML